VIANAASAKSYGVESEVIGRVLRISPCPAVLVTTRPSSATIRMPMWRERWSISAAPSCERASLDRPRGRRILVSFRQSARRLRAPGVELSKGAIKPDLTSEVHTGFPYDVPSYNVANLRLGVTTANWDVIAFAAESVRQEVLHQRL